MPSHGTCIPLAVNGGARDDADAVTDGQESPRWCTCALTALVLLSDAEPRFSRHAGNRPPELTLCPSLPHLNRPIPTRFLACPERNDAHACGTRARPRLRERVTREFSEVARLHPSSTVTSEARRFADSTNVLPLCDYFAVGDVFSLEWSIFLHFFRFADT